MHLVSSSRVYIIERSHYLGCSLLVGSLNHSVNNSGPADFSDQDRLGVWTTGETGPTGGNPNFMLRAARGSGRLVKPARLVEIQILC